MILYLDTSAIVKKYFKEPGSSEVVSRWKEALEIVTSSIAYAETMAAIYRKEREINVNRAIFESILDSFHEDWRSLIRVEVTDDLNKSIHALLIKYPLRGFDVIHLASALSIREKLPESFVLACFDRRLCQAAQTEGLDTLPTDSDALPMER